LGTIGFSGRAPKLAATYSFSEAVEIFAGNITLLWCVAFYGLSGMYHFTKDGVSRFPEILVIIYADL
jgi:hypothetical protein